MDATGVGWMGLRRATRVTTKIRDTAWKSSSLVSEVCVCECVCRGGTKHQCGLHVDQCCWRGHLFSDADQPLALQDANYACCIWAPFPGCKKW